MQVQFILDMYDLVINGRHIDEVIIDWLEEMEEGQILAISTEWLSSSHYLTKRMTGLHSVGESSLTIEPIDPLEGQKSVQRRFFI